MDRLISFVDMPKTWPSLRCRGSIALSGPYVFSDDQEPEATYHYAFRGRMDERFDWCVRFITSSFWLVRIYALCAVGATFGISGKFVMRAWEAHVQMERDPD